MTFSFDRMDITSFGASLNILLVWKSVNRNAYYMDIWNYLLLIVLIMSFSSKKKEKWCTRDILTFLDIIHYKQLRVSGWVVAKKRKLEKNNL